MLFCPLCKSRFEKIATLIGVGGRGGGSILFRLRINFEFDRFKKLNWIFEASYIRSLVVGFF